MLVKDYMTKHPPMANPKMAMAEAQHLMSENHVRHLPVVKDGKRLIGLLTRQSMMLNPGRLSSLDVWDITHYLGNLHVKDVMIKARDVITIGPDTPIEQAAQVMAEHGVGCLPVLEGEIVVGMITKNDLLTQLAMMMTGQWSGVRLTVRMPMKKGELARLVAAVAEQGLGIITMGGAPAPKDPDRWDAVIKIRATKEQALAALSGLEGQEIIDARDA